MINLSSNTMILLYAAEYIDKMHMKRINSILPGPKPERITRWDIIQEMIRNGDIILSSDNLD